ncbi:hypothetical protein PRIPAC_84960 [Pristionchus pacificus]|uniref:Uncharacterized protein n=1 Tax=Pristionchus pacificus TaxID=54126 RepID=A0A2A6BMZ9_PRIPA|nr:hypothetical protein PRIPAC_84960 [Pristionchus pacificus]|eukprot:PDM67279.1 hypothetical protein PRIPAC_48696 [Pristionchus pacificus]
MEKDAHGGRHSSKKRDAIAIDDDSASEEPVRKSAKNEKKPTPNSSQSSSSTTSAEDLEFQQNLARTYERYRAAREASFRAKKLLDAQGETVDGSGMADKASELARENESLKVEIAELRNKEIAANDLKSELARENESLKIEIAELRNKEIAANDLKSEMSRANARLKVEARVLKHKNEIENDKLELEIKTLKREISELKNSSDEKDKLNDELTRKNTALNEELETAKERADKEAETNSSLKKVLEESRKEEKAAANREIKLIMENTEMKRELKSKKAKAEQDINDLTVECLGLKKDLEAVRQSGKEGIDREAKLASENVALVQELEEIRKRADYDRIMDTARIKYLTHKLAQLGDQQNHEQSPEPIEVDEVPAEEPQSPAAQLQPLQQNPLQLKLLQSGPDDVDVDSTADQTVRPKKKKEKKERSRPAKIHERGDPINIFQLCRPNTSHSISLDRALRQIRDKFDEIGAAKIGECCKNMKSDKRIKCSVCVKRIKKHRVFDHVLSKEHIDKVRSHDAAVSAAALQHWLRELQQAAVSAADNEDTETGGAANDVSSGEL